MVNIFYLDYDTDKCAQYYCDKHVNKILIEITQLLCQVQYEYGDKIPPYKKCKAIAKGLAPYLWITESIDNYKWSLKLGYSLLKEFEYRYEKSHKSGLVLNWITNNLPNLPKKGITKFKFTENVYSYSLYLDEIEASRYVYVDFKCNYDKWTKRGKPYWFDKLQQKSILKKYKLIDKIKENVYEKLPKLVKNNKQIKVKRFHSFLRICYDNMFKGFWREKIKNMPKMFKPNKTLLNQLGYGHLLHIYDLSKKMFNLNKLKEMNEKSLKYREKN